MNANLFDILNDSDFQRTRIIPEWTHIEASPLPQEEFEEVMDMFVYAFSNCPLPDLPKEEGLKLYEKVRNIIGCWMPANISEISALLVFMDRTRQDNFKGFLQEVLRIDETLKKELGK